MAIPNFPSSPSNGQTYAFNNITYVYNLPKLRWEVQSSAVTGSSSSGWEFVEDIYEFGTDGTIGTVESPIFEAGYDYLIRADDLETNGTGTEDIQFSGSSSTDGYGGTLNLTLNVDTDHKILFHVEIYNPKNPQNGHHFFWDGGDDAFSTNTIYNLGALNQSVKTHTSVQTLDKVRFVCNGASFSGGKISMFRR